MRSFLFLVAIFGFLSCSSAQVKYSSSNKKAVKLFEEGKNAPNASIDMNTGKPNFREGIKLMNQAIEKDSNFWEPHAWVAEFYEQIGDYESAIIHYKEALRISPNHSSTGSTYFYLGNLQQAVGDYESSIRNLDIFLQNRNANPELQGEALKIRSNCEFAMNSMRSPRNFNPINVGPGINTADPEYFPTITVDGKTILFTRRIKDERVQQVQQQEDFYISQLNDRNMWGTAEPMPSNVNTVLNEGAPTIAADGRSLIFVACSDFSGDNYYGEKRSGKGSCDMFFTKKLGSRWTDPINLPGNVNTPTWESQPSLSADGKTLYFVRRVSKRGEPANSDIFVSKLMDNGQWSTALALPNYINTPQQEESVLIHPDGKTLYFASRGHVGMGGSDIYLTRMDDKGNWSVPENLGYPINTKYDENSLMVSPDGEIAFFASDRKGGYGDLDIYYFVMPEELRPTKTLYFEGIVFDANSKSPVPGKFQLIDLKSGKEVIFSEADKVTGEFLVSLPLNKEYALNVSYPGYTFFSKNFNMTNPDGLEAIHMDVPLVPITSDKPVLLENVFFDLSKATLRPESSIELDKLNDFLSKNSTIKIEIGGHTDTRGDEKENQKLSEDRAKAVYDYLIKKGVSPTRLSYRGYGESQPVVEDTVISKMNSEKEKETAHQFNRRTEYKIIK